MSSEKQKRYDHYYMDLADRTALMSYAKRKQVGCLIVKGDQIISYGWNGTPSGDPNDCEYVKEDGTLATKPEVAHAEDNALRKLIKSSENAIGAVMYITSSPCGICADRIQSAGVVEVIYKEYYVSASCGDGLERLHNKGIKTRILE